MKLVTIKLNGLYIATTEMTISNIRKAEKAGFTITTKQGAIPYLLLTNKQLVCTLTTK